MISKNQRCKMVALLKSLKMSMYYHFGFALQNPSSRVINIFRKLYIKI